MTAAIARQAPAPAPSPPERPRRRRHWLRWILASLAVLVVLVVGLVVVAIKLQPTPAPLTLPAQAAAPIGPVDGTYQAAPGSVAGFRIQQTTLGLTSDVVGRTADVTGSVAVTRGRIVDAKLHVNLLAMTSGDGKNGGKLAPQFGNSLDTGRYPQAAVELAQPVTLDAGFTSGATVALKAVGTLTLHGVTRTVTVPLSVRRDGTDIDVAGSVPVVFADYRLARPEGYGWFGSLADHGVAEFSLVLHHG
jgi:polyisoprenoid-binding protein YceI